MNKSQIKNVSNVAEIKISYSLDIPSSKLPKIISSIDASKILKESWDDDTIELVETCKCVYLNRANRVMGIVTISTGGLTGTLVDPARVFSGAIVANARGILLCHNHPSGNLNPSEADKRITGRIKAGGELLGITLLDHIIITRESYYSMGDNGDI